MRILQNAVTDGGFTEIVVCDTNGSSYSHDGTFANVSHRDYFQQALQGKTNVSEPLTSLVTGKETIVIAVPIPSQNSPSGVLLGVYPLDTAGAQLLDFTYYSTGYNFIVTPDGGIVLSSERADKLFTEKNIISFFEKTNLLDYSMAELKTAITNGQSKNFSFLYNGERRFVSFVPSGINDWYTFSIAPDTLMRQQENATNQIVLRLIVKLIILGLLLLTWIIISNRHHNKALLLANQKYQSLLDNINGGMIVATHAQNADAIIATYVSCGFTKMTGYTLQDIHDIYQGRYLELLLDEDRKDAFEKHWQQITIGNTYHVSYRIRKKDKSIIWVMDNGYLIKNADGLHNHSILTDITLIKQREEELRSSENRFSVAINASSGTLFEVDLEKKLYTHFENAERIFGVSAEKLFADTRAFSSLSYTEFIDAVTAYFFHPEDCQLTQNAMAEAKTNGMASYEARIRRFDNSYIWARIDLSFVLNEFGEPWRLVGYISDIDEIKKHAELLENKVQTDPMTGLYNKVAMATLTNKVLQEYPRQQHALIVLDIDNFKGINDTL
ncbi:MAG: PAS domain-containing protein, partial [Clostridiales bacterium]